MNDLERESFNKYRRDRRRMKADALAETAKRTLCEVAVIEAASILSIRHAVATSFGFTDAQLLSYSRSRKRRPYTARCIAMATARKLTRRSYPVIARYFDVDHTAVIRAVRKFGAMIEKAYRSNHKTRPIIHKVPGRRGRSAGGAKAGSFRGRDPGAASAIGL